MDFIMHNNIKFKRFIHNDAIKKRIKEIARDMNNYYLNNDREIIFIGVLNGCFYFMNELLSEINFNYQYHFLKLSSYKGMESNTLKKELEQLK